MEWVHHETMSFADTGAMVMRTDEGWDAFPFGPHAGASGSHASREEAMAAAEHVVVSTACCSGEAFGDDGCGCG